MINDTENVHLRQDMTRCDDIRVKRVELQAWASWWHMGRTARRWYVGKKTTCYLVDVYGKQLWGELWGQNVNGAEKLPAQVEVQPVKWPKRKHVNV